MVRAFVGIPLPAPAAEALMVEQAHLPAGRLVPAENFHVTLAFLGEHPMPVVEDVHYALARLAPPAFAWRFQGLDLLGGERAPRVVAALIRPEPALRHLRDRVVEAARSAGIEIPRARYTPHVTLARLNASLGPEERQRLAGAVARGSAFAAGPYPAERFALYRSHLGRNGAIYEEMASYELATASASISMR